MKTKLYSAVEPRRGRRTCNYQVWDKDLKRLRMCGAHDALDIKGEKGGHVAYLCAEHAAFFIDAHDRRSEEEKELEAVDA